MERLTERKAGITGLSACFDECDHANSGCDCLRIRSALRRLAAYEDTGLTPEEIAETIQRVKIMEKNITSMSKEISRLNGRCADFAKERGTLEKELETEKCALLSACKAFEELIDCENPLPVCKGCQADDDCVLHLLDYFRQQAQEQEGKK